MVYPGTIGDHFSTLTNLHTLKSENVQICLFILHFKRDFKPLLPTLRSITLRDPLCTPRQLPHFLSRFPNLDDTEIRRAATFLPDETAPGTELIPFPAPKMRGRLLGRNCGTPNHFVRWLTVPSRGAIQERKPCTPLIGGMCRDLRGPAVWREGWFK